MDFWLCTMFLVVKTKVRQRKTKYDIIYTWNLKKILMNLYTRQKYRYLENRSMDINEKGWGG